LSLGDGGGDHGPKKERDKQTIQKKVKSNKYKIKKEKGNKIKKESESIIYYSCLLSLD
jgi:hypothetical protein